MATWNGYGQYCPIARAADVLGERWTLMIVRDLLVGATRFNELARGLPGLSRSLLSKRLRQLEFAGIVERVDDQYLLTDAGEGLRPIVFGLGAWAAQHAFGDPRPEELDPQLLAWWMHTRIDSSALPDRRWVLHLHFTDARERFWLVVEQGEASICFNDPRFDIDVTMTTDLSTMYEVWLGRLPLTTAARRGLVNYDGTTAMVRRMPKVLQLSPAAEAVIATRA